MSKGTTINNGWHIASIDHLNISTDKQGCLFVTNGIEKRLVTTEIDLCWCTTQSHNPYDGRRRCRHQKVNE